MSVRWFVVALAACVVAAAADRSLLAAVKPPKVANISYNVLLRTGSGQELSSGGDYGFGQVLGKNGIPVLVNVGGSWVQEFSTNPDFSSFMRSGSTLYSAVHFESPRPAAMSFVRSSLDYSSGKITPQALSPVDWSAWDGLWIPCAGSVTPWGTHMGSEEYEPNARALQAALANGTLSLVDSSIRSYMRYWGYYPSANVPAGMKPLTIDAVREFFNPYKYGFVTEVAVKNGQPVPRKWYTLGRVASELGYVMPDRRTVYITDDGANVGYFMFKAKKWGDLSEGTLHCARFTQTSAEKCGSFDVSWIPMGTAKQSELYAAVWNRVLPLRSFDQIFETASPNAAFQCPTGFTSINQGGVGQECVKVKYGMETAAAFFETRRYAAVLGCTTEFSKWEGMTFDPDSRRVYTSMSDVREGMEDNAVRGVAGDKFDRGGPNHIKVPYNKCGCVYAMPVDANHTATSMYGLIEGRPIPVDELGNSCDTNGISNPDNIAYIPKTNSLIVGEDTDFHTNDAMYHYDLASGNLTRIFSTPFGSETTSAYWYPSLAGSRWSYVAAVVQHPYGECPNGPLPVVNCTTMEQKKADPLFEGDAGYWGYIGPIPSAAFSKPGNAWFEPAPLASGDLQYQAYSSSKVYYK